jgi:hypothetical protein
MYIYAYTNTYSSFNHLILDPLHLFTYTYTHTCKLSGIPKRIILAYEKCNKILPEKVEIIITAADYRHDTFVDNEIQIIVYPEGVIYCMAADADFTLFMEGICAYIYIYIYIYIYMYAFIYVQMGI